MKTRIFLICAAWLVCACILTIVVAPFANASEWKRISITSDKNNYFQGETATITIRPTETDTGETEYVTIKIFDYKGDLAKEYVNFTASNPTVVVWTIPSDAVPGIYDVNVYKPGSKFKINEETSETGKFTVHSSASIYPEIYFDKHSYLTGDTIKLWVNVIVSGKVPVSGPFRCDYTVVYGGKTTNAEELTTNYSFYIPSDFTGKVTFTVKVYDAAKQYEGTASASVTVQYGILLLNSNYEKYTGGESVLISYSLQTNLMTSPKYYYEITDAAGNLMASSGKTQGTVAGDSFLFNVPNNPSVKYDVKVYAEQNGFIVSQSQVLYRADEMTVNFEITTPSKYISGCYAPGDVITIHYEIRVTGALKMPSSFRIEIGIVDTAHTVLIMSNSSSGDISYALPTYLSNGNHIIALTVTSAATTAKADSVEAILIDCNPSAMQMNIGGMSLMDVFLFMLVIILFVVFVILLLRTKQKNTAVRNQSPTSTQSSFQQPNQPPSQQSAYIQPTQPQPSAPQTVPQNAPLQYYPQTSATYNTTQTQQPAGQQQYYQPPPPQQ